MANEGSSDTPKIWKSPEEIQQEQEQQNNSSCELVPQDEYDIVTLPVEEREQIIDAEASNRDKSILHSLVEISKTADVLKKIDNEELQDGRNKVLKAWYDAFIQNKMVNSHKIEEVIAGLADRLLNNIDNLDLEQTGILLEKLSNVNAIMAQRNFSDPSVGMPAGGQPAPAVNLTINNAAEGSSINNPTLNVGGPSPVKNLDNLSNLNSAMNAWNGAPRKVHTVDAESTEKK